jgi:hypothetical protein
MSETPPSLSSPSDQAHFPLLAVRITALLALTISSVSAICYENGYQVACPDTPTDQTTDAKLAITSNDEDALALVRSGITAPIVIAFIIMAGVFFTTMMKPKVAPSPEAEQYKARARKSWLVIYAGNAFQVLGFLSGLAAPSVPWLYGGSMISYGSASGGGYCAYAYGELLHFLLALLTSLPPPSPHTSIDIVNALGVTFKLCAMSVCTTTIIPLFFLAIGAIINYIGLILFIFPAFMMSWCAARRVRILANYSAMPPVAGCCCSASLPAITALSWVGIIIQIIGAAILWSLFGLATILLALPLRDGFKFMAASVAFNIIAAILFSISSCCCVGHIPYIGRSPTNCCCVNIPKAADAPALTINSAPKDVVVVVVAGAKV